MARLKAIIEIILLVDLGERARDLKKCVSWVPQKMFFLSLLMFAAKPRQRGAKCRGERAFNINRKHDLFHLRYFEKRPLEPGYKMCSPQKKKVYHGLKKSEVDRLYREL